MKFDDPTIGQTMDELGISEEVFSWIDPDDGRTVHFAISQMRAVLSVLNLPTTTVEIRPGYHEWLLENRGVNHDKAMALTDEQMDEPSILLALPDKHFLLVDGTHRVYRKALEGAPNSQAHVLTQDAWQHFVIRDMPNFTEDEIKNLPDRLFH